MKVFFYGPNISLLTVEPLLEGLSSFMSVDSATSPSVTRRMTGQRHTAKDESFQTRESNQKEICCYEHLFRIDAMCIGIGLMFYALVLR